MAAREPVQVYLAAPDRVLLDRIAKKAGVSRAEVLRRGVRRMAAEVLADENPMLSFIEEMASTKWPADTPSDVAERHDFYLTERERRASAKRPRKARRKR
jgi:hypothetical protein